MTFARRKTYEMTFLVGKWYGEIRNYWNTSVCQGDISLVLCFSGLFYLSLNYLDIRGEIVQNCVVLNEVIVRETTYVDDVCLIDSDVNTYEI